LGASRLGSKARAEAAVGTVGFASS